MDGEGQGGAASCRYFQEIKHNIRCQYCETLQECQSSISCAFIQTYSYIYTFSVPLDPQAVFFHCVYTPIKLLTVPAKPTIPSSKLARPIAVAGTVKSAKSEISCKLIAARSLLSHISISSFKRQMDHMLEPHTFLSFCQQQRPRHPSYPTSSAAPSIQLDYRHH